jgi:hypothetical protein
MQGWITPARLVQGSDHPGPALAFDAGLDYSGPVGAGLGSPRPCAGCQQCIFNSDIVSLPYRIFPVVSRISPIM